MLVRPDRDELARQDFVRSFKAHVQSDIVPGVHAIYAHEAKPAFERKTGRPPQDRHEIREMMVGHPVFDGYASLQRVSQELLWESVLDSVERELPRRIAAAKRKPALSTLELDPALPLPKHVTGLDVHCMPGGYCHEGGPDDVAVGAPLLRYAHARAEALGKRVHFHQADAARTKFPDGHFDLVVSSILFHETSAKALPASLRETHRLLAPGGLAAHGDLPPFYAMDEFNPFMLDCETYCNNERYWGAMREVDQIEAGVAAGFAREGIEMKLAPSAYRAAAGESEAQYAAFLREIS
jgi:SAM-dependent methyltransferase